MNITIVGAGYVGISLALLLDQQHSITLMDIDQSKVDKISHKQSPIQESEIQLKLSQSKILSSLIDYKQYKKSKLIFICVPTNYNKRTQKLDIAIIEKTIQDIIKSGSNATVVIKSTVGVGTCSMLKEKYININLLYMPEFLREGKTILDTFNPSRIIVGHCKINNDVILDNKIINVIEQCINNKKAPILYCLYEEAEAIKLFSNAYLAMRVSFFNELDTFSHINNLDSSTIIQGVCFDTRIGNYYNNPSFGYGGYCLPKDTKQLKTDFKNVPNKLLSSIVSSNQVRIKYIIDSILKNKNINTIGIYRLTAKTNSDNFKESAVMEIVKVLKNLHCKVLIYEPLCKQNSFSKIFVMKDFTQFASISDIIIANRNSEELKPYEQKVFTRDIFKRD